MNFRVSPNHLSYYRYKTILFVKNQRENLNKPNNFSIMFVMVFLSFIFLAYLSGSIPFGKLIAKMHGVDIQKKGSGNIGFTNSLRTLGWKPAVLVLIGDVCKGFIPAKLALQFFSLEQGLMIGIVAILAHIFPVWLKFKGGKGVATGLGVLLAVNPLIIAIGYAVFLIVFLLTKIISISSILGTASLSLISYFVLPKLTVFYLVLLVIAIWTHRKNVDRLLKGTEKRIIN